MSKKNLTVTFDLFTGFGASIPCVATVERRSGGFIVTEMDATTDDGSELPDELYRQAEEKAVDKAHAEFGEFSGDDIAERDREHATECRCLGCMS
jgi:transposase